jgi:hypothetical protein
VPRVVRQDGQAGAGPGRRLGLLLQVRAVARDAGTAGTDLINLHFG